MRKNQLWWYVECPICSNLDNFGYCKKALFRPEGINGVCKHYKGEDN